MRSVRSVPSATCGALVSALMITVPASALASPLIYTPVNPDFGGNPLNSSELLGVANAINKFQAPVARAQTPSQQFVQQLQSELLAGLAQNVVQAIFGPNAQQSGQLTFSDQTVSFVRTLSEVDIDVLNNTTGQTTHIAIPLLAGSSSPTSSAGP